MKNKILLFTVIIILLLTTIQAKGQEYEIQRDYITEVGSWTTLTYTPNIYLNYPEYYPFEISFNSLGELPDDLKQYYNYSNTVFIGHFIITSSLDSFDSIDRERDEDELIGLKPLKLSFELSDIPKNISMIKMEIRFLPWNTSLGLSSDVYDLELQLLHEATFDDLLFSLLLIAGPLIVIFSWFLLHRWLNKKFLDNVGIIKVPFYFSKYLKRKFSFFKYPKIKLKTIGTVLAIFLIIALFTIAILLVLKWLS